MKRYFITGATGHIGDLIVRELVRQNQKVVCLVLPKDNHEILKSLNVEILDGNICDREFILKAIKPGDIVIHLAGIISISNTSKDLIYKVNYEGTKNIADSCLENHARLIYTSSVHVLKAIKNGTINENVGFNVESKRGPYEETKSLATSYIFKLFEEGLDGVVLYPSAIIGPNDNFVGEVSRALIMLYRKKMPAYIKGGYSFVDVRDVAQGILNAANAENITKKGYILSHKYISIKDLMNLVYDHYGYKHKPGYCPLFLVYLGLPFIWLHSKITKTSPIFTRIMLKTVLSNGSFDNSNAKKDLDFTTRPLIDSITDSLEWLKENHPELF